MDFVSEYLGKRSEITEDLIKKIHKILVKDVLSLFGKRCNGPFQIHKQNRKQPRSCPMVIYAFMLQRSMRKIW